MRDGWVETTLDRVTECSWGNTETTKSKYVESGYLAYSASGADGFLDWFEHDRSAVVLSAIGAQCGKTWFAEGKWTSIKNTIWLKSDNLNLLDKYLFYLSNRDQFWQIRGQAQPFISLGDVKKTKVLLPPLPEQKKIVDLISSVDSYNKALQQQLESAKRSRNAVLHELMSQALDENRKPLIELAKLQRGHDLPTQDRIEGSIPVVASNGVVGFHNTHKAIGPGVVTGRSGTIGKVIYIDDDYWPLNTTLYVIDFKGNHPKFVALVLETLKLENYAGGSTVPSLDRNVLSQVPVPYPSIKEQERIVGIIQSLDEVVAKSEHAISQAKILRTGLLSDLLSGTHEIPASYDQVIGAA